MFKEFNIWLTFLSSLGMLPKILITVIIIAIACLFLYAIWVYSPNDNALNEMSPETSLGLSGSIIHDNQQNTLIKQNSLDAIVQEFKKCDSSYAELERSLDIVVPHMFNRIEKVRHERNTYDLEALKNIEMPQAYAYGIGDFNKLAEEILYVVNCLDTLGYIELQAPEKNNFIMATTVKNNEQPIRIENRKIRFKKPYIDLMARSET